MARLMLASVLLGTWMSTSGVHAQDGAEPRAAESSGRGDKPLTGRRKPVHQSPHLEEETANIVGLKGGFVNVFSNGEYRSGGNVGPFYERNLISGWLELEAALAVTFVGEETVLGFDAFFKKPFHVNPVVNPYVGLGPNLSVIFGRESTLTRFGILGVAGAYFWFGNAHRWGFDLELVYLALFDSDLTHELTLEVGPVYRF